MTQRARPEASLRNAIAMRQNARFANTHSCGQPSSLLMSHPCLRCGACCAYFRVAFYWGEQASVLPGGVPDELTERRDPLRVAMRGTQQSRPRCIALQGQVAVDAHCGIYPQRPSPCRELQPAWEFGEASPQCDRARIAHGLRPLRVEDWQTLVE